MTTWSYQPPMGLSTLILVHFRLHFSLNPKKSGKVIHRVVVEPRGIITKGDNLAWVDDWTLQPGDILGKVVAIHRQGRALPVPKHAPASLYLLKARRWCDRAASRFLQPVYHRLARSGLLRGRLGQWMRPQLLYFSRADGPEGSSGWEISSSAANCPARPTGPSTGPSGCSWTKPPCPTSSLLPQLVISSVLSTVTYQRSAVRL
jgi:hypothetical protein